MGVYNDMANDAGYAYGTAENELMAQNIERAEMEHCAGAIMEEEYREWSQRFVEHVVESGLSQDEAYDIFSAMDHVDLGDDPIDVANEEMSLWASDG